MHALEVSINGEPLYTIANPTGFGSVSFNLIWSRVQSRTGSIIESAFMFGLRADVEDDAAGPRRDLELGDEVTIRLIETGRPAASAEPHA